MEHYLFTGTTVTEVWYQSLAAALKPGKKILSPVLMSLQDFDPDQCEIADPVRTALDALYKKHNFNSVITVANTIFPLHLSKLARGNRQTLYDSYKRVMDRRIAIDRRNRGGLYFERLISYDDTPEGNQLEFIIREFTGRSGVRNSMLQASIFDPKRDHRRDAQVPFPCLQHVSFSYDGDDLSVHAFYATQQLFDKAYGNLLGLVRLGNFMAKQMGKTLKKVNCYVGQEKLERINKTDADLMAIVNIAKGYLGHE